jgi:hypothetical protein
MLETYRRLIVSQYEAVLSGLNFCLDRCPDALWEAPVGDVAFCQVVFHALFYADYYLEPREDTIREQPFHRENPAFFRDYEELAPRVPVHLYARADIKRYLQYCRDKAGATLTHETEAVLSGPSGFARRTIPRAELHVYNIRHLQDHVAQLNGFLAVQIGLDIPWFGGGWHTVE